MSSTVDTSLARPLPSGLRAGGFIVIAAWLAAVIALAGAGLFHAAPTEPPLAVLAAIAGPPALFLLGLRLSPRLRGLVLAIDPVWLTAIQGLRMVGVGFLLLYAFGELPGLFAHPAGWGDMLVAVLAPFAAARLARDPDFLASRTLWGFHLLGLADFLGAVGSALVARGLAVAEGGATTLALGQLPLAIIPTFAVPLWICLHIAAMLQIRAARRRR